MKKQRKKIEQMLSIKIAIIVFVIIPYIILFFAPTNNIFGEIIRFYAIILTSNIAIIVSILITYALYKTWIIHSKSEKILLILFIIFLSYLSLKYTPNSISDTIHYMNSGAKITEGEVTYSLEGIRTQYYLIELNNDSDNPLHAHAGPNLIVGNTYRIHYLPYSRSILRAELIAQPITNK